MQYSFRVPVLKEDLSVLRAGDVVLLSGELYTARDAAHARFAELLSRGESLPVPKGATIYYAGPCPAAPGEVIGPCGPTTSKRMDRYTPALVDYGICQFIGKGARSSAVNEAMWGRAVHFSAYRRRGHALRLADYELRARRLWRSWRGGRLPAQRAGFSGDRIVRPAWQRRLRSNHAVKCATEFVSHWYTITSHGSVVFSKGAEHVELCNRRNQLG